ncbi:helix-turn-helix transcriptional regulator [Shewanella salipaludis]|uniref:Helix-turn-helix transcriptional regulator n=1 Tax=Shewanella salipaludis TaxID=2723052 RepID=A0A972FSM9_9GAMM|nr:AraC family transcriptional regulator [Shewanella salipaludis]NMH64962.1 helix-turn-helix transcriptional regulator [Shewanella salipaludis]
MPDHCHSNAFHHAVTPVLQVDDIAHAGITAGHWRVDRQAVDYERASDHTLSLYLAGGEGSYRLDKRLHKGGPGCVSIMPQAHSSQWHIEQPTEFIHCYISDTGLKQFAAGTLNQDVRCVELRDLLYADEPQLQQLMTLFVRLSQESSACSLLAREQCANEIFNRLLTQHNVFHLKKQQLSGGLSVTHMKQVNEMIHSRLGTKLTLDELAGRIHLSPFHFARMFKISFGSTPAQYITLTRLKQARQLLKGKASLAEISLQTGFSHQSHMTSQFKQAYGLTPARYRALS